MKLFVRAIAVWIPVWVLLLTSAFFLSEGEPVCSGPLILAVRDSMPPGCDSPAHGLPLVGAWLFIVGLIPISIGTGAVLLWRKTLVRARTS